MGQEDDMTGISFILQLFIFLLIIECGQYAMLSHRVSLSCGSDGNYVLGNADHQDKVYSWYLGYPFYAARRPGYGLRVRPIAAPDLPWSYHLIILLLQRL